MGGGGGVLGGGVVGGGGNGVISIVKSTEKGRVLKCRVLTASSECGYGTTVQATEKGPFCTQELYRERRGGRGPTVQE